MQTIGMNFYAVLLALVFIYLACLDILHLHEFGTFIFSPLTSTLLIMKSTPIVAPCPGGNKPWKITSNYTNMGQSNI